MLSLGLMGISSCAPSLSEMCKGEFSTYDQSIQKAQIALEAPVQNTRGPASFNHPPDLSASEREAWTVWARDLLKKSQRYLDRVIAEPEFPRSKDVEHELTELNQHIVRFHAYVELGRAEGMHNSLKKIRDHAARARGMVCPAT
jgi:hypothetical protein